MKKNIIVLMLMGLIIFTGCKSGAEKRADAAWEASKSLTAGEKLMKQKEAYIFYKQALDESKGKASSELKNKFIESAISRINFIYDADGGKAQAIIFIREEIDKLIDGDDISAKNKDDYSAFIMKLANDAQNAGDLSLCMADLEAAISHAANKSVPEGMKADISKEFSDNQLKMAQDFYNSAKKEKNIEDYIRAEYYTHVALNYAPNNKEALDLLSKCRQKLTNTYTAFVSVIDVKPDTALYNKIDSTDILMAVPAIKKSKSTVTMQVNIYNYSYGAIRLKPEYFYLLDEKGNKYKAKSLKSDKNLLDTEMETKMTLTFRRPSSKIKAIVYESHKDGDDHFAAKYFF